MPDVAVNGTTLHYEAIGNGPTCLVVHGWPGADHTYLRPGLDVLARSLRLVFYDQRGHGRSSRPPAQTITIEELAGDAAALVGRLGGGPVLVLGHNHGAAVAQELALRHPDRVAGLILVAATPGELGSQESLADTLDLPLVPVEADGLQRVPPASDDELAGTMRALAAYFFPRPETADAEAVFARTTWSSEAAVRWTLATAWWTSVDHLGEIAVPAALIAGRHDIFCPPQQSQRIARHLNGASTTVLEQSGHLPWLDEPEPFVAAVDGWLATNDLLAEGGGRRPAR